MHNFSTLGGNYRFLSDKYDKWSTYWIKLLSVVLKKLYDYVDTNVYSANEAIIIIDLCIKQDSRDFSFFNIDKVNKMVILLIIT